MMKLTASQIVRAVASLPKNRSYDYANPRTQTKIEIENVILPEGPIYIRRYNPSKGKGPKKGNRVSISSQLIWRVANSLNEAKPINLDRVLGGSYNTRSAFEALLLHTPEFYTCLPGRIEIISSSTDIKRGHKHLLWLPNQPHRPGSIHEMETDIVISEFSSEAVYEALEIPLSTVEGKIDIALSRRHAQIQIALVMVGLQLGFRTWVANNDKGIVYKNKKLGEMEGVIPSLRDEKLLQAYDDATHAALLIDCIWFRNNKFMPAVMEIEHSTGVTSGLTRMKNFYDYLPRLQDVRWVIVAPDEDRDKVLREVNKEQFKELNPKYFPYSGVEELYSLCQRRKLQGVTDSFLDCFMEPCIGKA